VGAAGGRLGLGVVGLPRALFGLGGGLARPFDVDLAGQLGHVGQDRHGVVGHQSITRDALRLLTSDDGGALIRLFAGDIAGFTGPGVTHTPITYAHVILAPGVQVSVSWNPAFNALAYALSGRGTARPEGRPVEGGQLVVFGPGDHLVVGAAGPQAEPLDVLLLGGLPIGAAIASYGPSVMNTREEILQAIEDNEAGRLGIVPADQLAPRNYA
jgi:quercetin 2,3-dioxygenase